MLFREILVLFFAGLSVVTATNSSSSSSDAATGSSSSSATATTASSSSAAATTASSSTGTTAASSSTTGTTAAASSSTTGTTAAASSATTGTTATGSSAATTTTGNATTTTEAVTPKPLEVVQASVTTKVTLPAGTTGADLMADADFRDGFAKGLASAMSITKDSISISEFKVGSRRERRQLTNGTAGATKQDVSAKFVITLGTGITATTLDTSLQASLKTGTGGFSNLLNNAGLTFGGAVVQADETVAGTATTVAVATINQFNTGTYSMKYYTDKTCMTSASTETPVVWSDFEGAIGAAGCKTGKAGPTGDVTVAVYGCAIGYGIYMHTEVGTTCPHTAAQQANAMWQTSSGDCQGIPGVTGYWTKIRCQGAAAATSAASSKTVFGAVASLVIGLVALM